MCYSCDPPVSEETTTTDELESVEEKIVENEPLVIDKPDVEPNEIILEADASEWLIYEGTIPCADCQGIQMRLKLENISGSDDKSYELTETYIGTKDGDRIYQSRGIYQITYGHEKDPSAILITLVDKNNDQRVLIQENAEKLTLLNTESQKINSQQNYSLIKL